MSRVHSDARDTALAMFIGIIAGLVFVLAFFGLVYLLRVVGA